ncbi:AMP-binding protein [Zwartia sp.]|uniref:AMP-binding protein n=1 Tax=Zwartia sp. TaxID=2978004 RepID=UPI00271D2566|nr:AMP-binding protein [Zwartia sp.]MDO9025052.1 AMP-binding protein [Zwartia sp.]
MLAGITSINHFPKGMLDQYASLFETFRWLVPTHFNIGQECCHRWANSSADARKIALFFEDATGQRDIWTYERLGAATNQFANALTRMGVKAGDRVAIALGQSPEAVIAQLGAYIVGAVALPLATHLAPKALEFRIRDSEAKVAVVGSEAAQNLLSIVSRCNKLSQVIGVGVTDERALAWRSLMLRQSEQFKPHITRADEPALLVYHSDTSHPARGVLVSHSALIGALPGFVAAHNWFPHHADVFWTPLEWTHSTALLCGLLPTLYFGKSILGVRGATTPGHARELLSRYRITHALITTTMLGQLRINTPADRLPLTSHLRSIAVHDQVVDESLAYWCERHFGLVPNQIFGTPEMPALIGDSQQKWPGKRGSLGKTYPGHRIAVLREDGSLAQLDEVGELAVHQNDAHQHLDPAFPLRNWREEAEQPKAGTAGWWLTGEMARIDQDGYIWHSGNRSRGLNRNKTAPSPEPTGVKSMQATQTLLTDKAPLSTPQAAQAKDAPAE